MNVTDKLASAINERGGEPNKMLAREIAAANDTQAVKELVANLHNKSIQSDCIKVLYETGELQPKLIAGYAKEFIELLDNKNNRMQWGAMTALDLITLEHADLVYKNIGKIIAIADKGSVITKDHCAGILIKLCALPAHAERAYPLLIEHLANCPPNQLPMYAEQALPVVNNDNKTKFIKVLEDRMPDIEKDTKKNRVKKVIKELNGY